MNKHFYIRRDGNGGYNVSRALALIVTIFTLLSLFGSLVYGYGSLHTKVDSATEIIPVHNQRINDLEIVQGAIKEKVDLTYNDVKDIKHYLLGEI